MSLFHVSGFNGDLNCFIFGQLKLKCFDWSDSSVWPQVLKFGSQNGWI